MSVGLIRSAIFLFLGFALALAPKVQADMGSLTLKKGVEVFEPKQDAILAWNGHRQILYLKTTLHASEATRVIEVMPLPSRPQVDAVDRGVFKRMAFYLPRPDTKEDPTDPFGSGESKSEPVGAIVEKKQIGAHQIASVQVKKILGFVQWVQAEFALEESVEFPQPLVEVIQEYLDDGYEWFLFDTIDLTADVSEKVPLRIQFDTPRLYYPLRITRVENGDTEVNLSVVTDVLFEPKDMIGIKRESLQVRGRPRSFEASDLQSIDEVIPSLFSGDTRLKVRSWTIAGKLNAFTQDLLVGHPKDRVGDCIVEEIPAQPGAAAPE